VVIRLDISNLPNNIKSIILNMMDLNPVAATVGNDFKSHDSDRKPNNITDSTVSWQTEDDVLKIKQILKDALIRNRIRDYVVIEDPQEKDMLMVLKKAHAERLGIYHCPHCGMAFDSEIQLATHHRMHYYI
jgi:hypothetical protein